MDYQAILALILESPELQPAFKRAHDLDEHQHRYYDMILAEAALQSSWPDGDVVALIQEANSRNLLKVPTDIYCTLLIEESRMRTKTGNLDVAREGLVSHLSSQWGINVARVIRHGTENAIWHLQLSDGREIRLGNSKDLLSQPTVRIAIFDVTGHVIPRFVGKQALQWDQHLEFLALVAEVVDSPELTRLGVAQQLLLGYLESQHCSLDYDASEEDWEALALSNRPFLRNHDIHIHLRHWWTSYVHVMDHTLSQTDLVDLARLMKFTRVTIACNESKTSRSYWKSKASYVVGNKII